MNESLNAPGLGRRPAEGMPEALPRLMGLQVKIGIEKFESEEPPRVRGEHGSQCVVAG